LEEGSGYDGKLLKRQTIIRKAAKDLVLLINETIEL